ncbi:HNH endonuclease [Mycolicibacterium llatzerense]|uniref:HNH endonuclease n=1 Tax=Mycolicibacterium llatzerense TaxID=280871 RepID=UPI0021B5CBF2|nr:HNH endonuclease [Mycolicibacterium llatzerense]
MPRAPKHCGKNGCTILVTPGKPCPDHPHGWKNSPRTASSQITSTWQWQQLVPKILERDQHRCQIRYPGRCLGVATVVDKKQPASRRPDLAYNPENLRAACVPCNDHKARTEDRR